MNTFIASTAILTLLVIAWVIRPLLRKTTRQGVSVAQVNTAVHRDQLAALKADLNRNIVSQQDYETSVEELQMRLLDDTESYQAKAPTVTATFWSSKRTALLIGLCLPLFAIPLYLKLGAPAAIDPVAVAQVTDQQIRQMVETLAAKLKENPDNPKGWAMLAKSYKVMGLFDASRQAFERVGTTLDSDPELLVDYADVLAVLANNQLEGKPLMLVNKALTINPKHPMGLMMSGVAAYRRADFKLAISNWETLLTMLEPGSADAQQIEEQIAAAQSNAGITPQRKGNNTPSNAMPPVPAGASGGMTPEMINQMVERLAKRLETNPEDLQGWARLARAYKVQGRLPEAIKAYEKSGSLLDKDADLLSQYADTLATHNNSLKGKPTVLLQKALAINPKHPSALMMAAQAAYQEANYGQAIVFWERVLSVLPADAPDTALIRSEIADAKIKSGQKP